MPWHVGKSGSCPASKPWAVIKDADGTVEGCHSSKAKAQKQMAALHASEGKKMSHHEKGCRGIPRDDIDSLKAMAKRDEKNIQEGAIRYAVAPITGIDVRDTTGTEDNTWTMSGYAAVFNETTTLYDSKFVRLTESIDPGFFDGVLRSQEMTGPSGVVHFNFGHDMNRAVAATDVPAGQPGSLQLSADSRGLHFLAKVPRDDPDGVAMAAKMRSGVVRQASFAFTIAKAQDSTIESEDGPSTEHRVLLEAKHLYDVCATAQGAYPQTVSALRSYAAALGQPSTEGGHPHQPDLGGGTVVSPNGEATAEVSEPDRYPLPRKVAEGLLRFRPIER